MLGIALMPLPNPGSPKVSVSPMDPSAPPPPAALPSIVEMKTLEQMKMEMKMETHKGAKMSWG